MSGNIDLMSDRPASRTNMKTPVYPCDLRGVSSNLMRRILKKHPELTREILWRWYEDKSPGICMRTIGTSPLGFFKGIKEVCDFCLDSTK